MTERKPTHAEEEEYEIIFGKKYPKYVIVNGKKYSRVTFFGLDPESAIPEEREPTLKDILEIITTSWPTNVIYPCEYAMLYYFHKKGIVDLKILKLLEPTIDIERAVYKDFRYLFFPFKIGEGHHYSKHTSYRIAYSLVVYRGACAHLIRHNPAGYEYDGASYPCEEICGESVELLDWRRCSNCEKRVGSLPILFEVGGLTQFTKVYNDFVYEVWVVSDSFDPDKRRILAVRMVKGEGELRRVATKVLDYLRSKLPTNFRELKIYRGKRVCVIEELLNRPCYIRPREGPLCDVLYEPGKKVDEKIGKEFLKIVEEGLKDDNG